MKLIFILLLITGATVLYGYPAYQLHQAEKRERIMYKQIPSNVVAHRFDRIGKQMARADFLNQYPNFMLYIMFPQYEGKTLPNGVMEKLLEDCDALNRLKSAEPIRRQATLNVTEQDHITFKYQVKNKFGDVLLEHQQVIAECPNFIEIKNYQPPQEDSNNFNDNPPPISKEKMAEIEAKERKAQNGF